MDNLRRILARNREWAAQRLDEDPQYFRRREARQEPHFLFISCSDSRVPVNELTGTEAGEMFVHRNIANQVFLSDLNALAVVQYAVDVLDVKHIVVCGHYGCGGIRASLRDSRYGLVDHWLASIRALQRTYAAALAQEPDDEHRLNRLTELNVLQQLHRLTLNPTIREAWRRGRRPLLHGMVYDMGSGILNTLVLEIDGPAAAADKLRDFVPV